MRDEELESWFQRNEIAEETRTLIRSILTLSPSRRVGGGYANFTVLYPSNLTQETRQAESYRGEFPAIYKMEWERTGENRVVYYVDQPPPFKVRFQNAEGLNIATEQTPDFFVFRECEAGWEEWATEEELLDLQKKYPARYYKDGSGVWHDSAGEAHAKPYGLYYRLRSTAEINWVYQRNIRWLEDFLTRSYPPVSVERRELVKAYVAARPAITLDELYTLASPQLKGDTVDVINSLIATNEIYVDLYDAPIPEPSQVHVFISKELAPTLDYRAKKIMPTFALASVRTGCALNWDSRIWKVINVGESKISLLADDGQILQFLVEQIESLICKGQILVETPSEDADATLRDLSDVGEGD